LHSHVKNLAELHISFAVSHVSAITHFRVSMFAKNVKLINFGANAINFTCLICLWIKTEEQLRGTCMNKPHLNYHLQTPILNITGLEGLTAKVGFDPPAEKWENFKR
jgi:hypothetical protein